MQENKYISEIHSDLRLWQTQLLLAKDQLKSFQNRLQEVNSANSSRQIRSEIEHFQNQFISENEVIDILIHDIREEEFNLSKSVKQNWVAVDHRKVSYSSLLRERMLIFNKIFLELRVEFTRFMSITM